MTTDGPRHRGASAASGGGDEAPQAGQKEGETSVALKKEIGLVSACGIIVGELSHISFPLLCFKCMMYDVDQYTST